MRIKLDKLGKVPCSVPCIVSVYNKHLFLSLICFLLGPLISPFGLPELWQVNVFRMYALRSFSKEKSEMLINCKNCARNFLLKVISFCGFFLNLPNTTLHTHHAKCIYNVTPSFTAIKHNARRNIKIIKSNHFRVDTSVTHKVCWNSLITDSDPLTLAYYWGYFLFPFPSISFSHKYSG